MVWYTTYCIKDPETQAIVYVGQTRDLEARKAEHLKPRAKPNISSINIKVWIHGKLELGQMPIFEPLEQCRGLRESLGSEAYWVAKLSADGQGAALLNNWRLHKLVRDMGMACHQHGLQVRLKNPMSANTHRELASLQAEGEPLVEMRHGKAWTDDERARLDELAGEGLSLRMIGRHMGRTTVAARLQLGRQGWPIPRGADDDYCPAR